MKLLKAIAPLLLAGATTAAAQAPNPNQVHIKKVRTAGSGCAQGTVVGDVSSDGKAFTFIFSDYIAEAGPGLPGGLRSKDCTLTVDLRVPQGWSYTVVKVDYAGYADLDAGATASQTSSYYFQANPNSKVTWTSTYTGPFTNDFEIYDTFIMEDVVWSECNKNRALNIETSVDVQVTGDAYGMIGIDSIDGSFEQIYGIQWKQC